MRIISFSLSKDDLISMNLFVNENFQVLSNQAISSQFSGRVHVLQKIIRYQHFLTYLRNHYKISFQ